MRSDAAAVLMLLHIAAAAKVFVLLQTHAKAHWQ
jgi:hypothetical protein